MNLLKALATVSSMTLLSRILGFVRDAVIARTFGAGIFTDAFFVAFRLPNLLRRLFAEGAFSQAFVPILAEYKNRRGLEATRQLLNRVATLLSLVLAGVALLGVLGAPLIVMISAPGFTADPDKFRLTVQMLRIVFPYILFISLVALAAGVMNTFSRFSVPAFTPSCSMFRSSRPRSGWRRISTRRSWPWPGASPSAGWRSSCGNCLS